MTRRCELGGRLLCLGQERAWRAHLRHQHLEVAPVTGHQPDARLPGDRLAERGMDGFRRTRRAKRCGSLNEEVAVEVEGRMGLHVVHPRGRLSVECVTMWEVSRNPPTFTPRPHHLSYFR